MPVASFATFLSVSWSAFVAAFLYYVGLTLLMVGGAELSIALVAVAYLLPVSLYAALLASRAVHALSSVRVEIGETPHALIS